MSYVTDMCAFAMSREVVNVHPTLSHDTVLPVLHLRCWEESCPSQMMDDP